MIADAEIDTIVGAFEQPDVGIFRALLEAADEPGDLAEFGVLYGRSAVLLGAYLRSSERFTVVDLFETAAGDDHNRAENDAWYPGLTRAGFEANYLRFHDRLPTIVQGPSPQIEGAAAAGGHRFVHIDASHLYEHVTVDIEVAHRLLRPDGIVVLDDFRAEHTPGVAAAAWQAVHVTGLRPFALSPNKMYATWGEAERWREIVRARAAQAGLVHEEHRIAGRTVLRVGARGAAGPHPAKRYVPEVLWPALARMRALRH